MNRGRVWVVLALLACGFGTAAGAQETTTGSIGGQVTDEQGACSRASP